MSRQTHRLTQIKRAAGERHSERRFTWPAGLDTPEEISTMTAIRSYMAATDFSPGSNAALERAVSLAVMHGASLRLLHAFTVAAVP